MAGKIDEFPAKFTKILKKANTNNKGKSHHFLCSLIIKKSSINKSLFELIFDFFRFGFRSFFFSSFIISW